MMVSQSPPAARVLLRMLVATAAAATFSATAAEAAIPMATRCAVCKNITRNVHLGITKTDTIEFTGGSEGWTLDNEKFMGRYKMTEARFSEILEGVCNDTDPNAAVPESFSLGITSGDRAVATPKDAKCLQELEVLEDMLEEWWKGTQESGDYSNLEQHLCFDEGKLCCPPGTWGKTCEACPGAAGSGVCGGNGSCNGESSRGGTGKCKCRKGFARPTCATCKPGHQLVKGTGKKKDKCVKDKTEL